jgi:nucleotide sugar dehydrogenase
MPEKIAVIGVGKLGICFALNLERAGYEVYGIESQAEYLRSLQNQTFNSTEPEVNELLARSSDLYLTDDISCISKHAITDIFIMVATPSLADGGYDHSQVERVVEKLVRLGDVERTRNLYIGCTTMPGYCNDLAQRLAPLGYTVSYNPEFIAQGAIIQDQLYPDQVLIGEANLEVGNRLQGIYQQMVRSKPVYCRMDPLSAEIAKLATNCFLTTKISFANSIGDLAVKAGADANKILSAIGSDSRIGGKYLQYGYGFGGPCFPRDNRALGKFGVQMKYPLHLSKATDIVNDAHFQFQLERLLETNPEGSLVVFDGVAYKKGTAQLVESQQFRLAVAVASEGRQVIIKDVPEIIDQVEKLHPGLFLFEPVSEIGSI